MKTKKEICQETGISESTFTFWQGKGLIPKPDGIEKRSALWSDITTENIRFIQTKQAEGMSLDEILGELSEFYKEKWLENKKDVDRFAIWKDEKGAIKKLTDILGFYPGDHPDVMLGSIEGRDYVFVTTAHDGVVTFSQIDFTMQDRELVVNQYEVPVDVYAVFIQMRAYHAATEGRILNTNGDAFVALSPQGKALLEDAEKRTKAQAKLIEYVETVLGK